MSLTGIFLILFCCIHLAGNLLLYVGEEAFNVYTYKMTHNKAILYFLEAGLIVGFGFHIVMAIWTSVKNKRARPIDYKRKRTWHGNYLLEYNVNFWLAHCLFFGGAFKDIQIWLWRIGFH